MGFQLALVQPIAHRPPDDERNVLDALRQISYAASQGAEVVAFPETYPGPWRTPMTFDPTEAMTSAAKEHGVTIQFGTLEEVPGEPRAAYNVLKLVGPDGTISGTYRRTHPPGPWIYSGGVWDFDYRAGDEYPVFESDHGAVGLAMCSEAFMPEDQHLEPAPPPAHHRSGSRVDHLGHGPFVDPPQRVQLLASRSSRAAKSKSNHAG